MNYTNAFDKNQLQILLMKSGIPLNLIKVIMTAYSNKLPQGKQEIYCYLKTRTHLQLIPYTFRLIYVDDMLWQLRDKISITLAASRDPSIEHLCTSQMIKH